MGFDPGTPRRKADTITTELKRILANAAVRYCTYIGKQPYLKEWSPVTHPVLKSSFILLMTGNLIRQDIKWD